MNKRTLEIIIAFSLGIAMGFLLSNDRKLMKDAGIERIVRCTSTSNVVKIIWTDGRVTKVGAE